MQQQDSLQAPPQTLAVNSIVVDIGDFKGQNDADKQQVKEREMKRQKQKKQLDQELKQQREAKILQKYTANEAKDDVMGPGASKKVMKLNTLNNPDMNRKSVSSQKEPHVVSIDLKNKNFFVRQDEPEKKASQVLNKSRTSAGLLKPSKTQTIPNRSTKTPIKKPGDTDRVTMPNYNDPLQKMFEKSQERGNKKLFNDYLEAQQENEDTLTGEDNHNQNNGPYEQMQIEAGLYKSDEEKPGPTEDEEDLERQREFESQRNSLYKRKSSQIELQKDIQSRINVAKQSDQILQDRQNQPKKPAKTTNFIKQNRKEVLKKKSLITPNLDQKYLSQQQDSNQDVKNGSSRKNRQQRNQKQPDKEQSNPADDMMLMKLLKE